MRDFDCTVVSRTLIITLGDTFWPITNANAAGLNIKSEFDRILQEQGEVAARAYLSGAMAASRYWHPILMERCMSERRAKTRETAEPLSLWARVRAAFA